MGVKTFRKRAARRKCEFCCHQDARLPLLASNPKPRRPLSLPALSHPAICSSVHPSARRSQTKVLSLPLAAVAGMKPTERRFILLDEGVQCALPDIVGALIDALEILEDPFALSIWQCLDRCFHRTQKIRGLGRPIDWLRKIDGPSAEISLQVRWLNSPQETWQAKAHGPAPVPHSRGHILCPWSLNSHDIGLPRVRCNPKRSRKVSIFRAETMLTWIGKVMASYGSVYGSCSR